MTNNEILQKGIDLAKGGNSEQASTLLAQAVKRDPGSEEAWLWLGRCRTASHEKRLCFNKVLSINPENEEAEKELRELDVWAEPSQPSSAPRAPVSDASPASAPTTSTSPAPPKKNWVRRTIYLLAGIMVGIYVGR